GALDRARVPEVSDDERVARKRAEVERHHGVVETVVRASREASEAVENTHSSTVLRLHVLPPFLCSLPPDSTSQVGTARGCSYRTAGSTAAHRGKHRALGRFDSVVLR